MRKAKVYMYTDWAGILKEDEEGYYFQYRDFEVAMRRFEIDQKAFDNIFERFKKAIPKWHAFVEISFLPDEIEHEVGDARRDDYSCEIPWDHYKTIINP